MNRAEIEKRADELRDKIYKLKEELAPLEEKEGEFYHQDEEAKKEAILKDNGLTEDEVEEIAWKLSRTKEIMVFYDEVGENSECEDDGAIHVTRKGIRFCKEGRESELPAFAKRIEKELAKEKGDKND